MANDPDKRNPLLAVIVVGLTNPAFVDRCINLIRHLNIEGETKTAKREGW